MAFATLDPRYRTDGAALFSLVRNIGSSIGISIVTVLLTRNIQVNHAELAAGMTPYNQTLATALPSAVVGDPTALSQLDALISQQAAMIAYIDDFKLMMIVTLLAMPLALLLKKPKQAVAAGAPAAHMD
jgi:DHA2 family multidrug resistance protein